jgi:hypothetical protein
MYVRGHQKRWPHLDLIKFLFIIIFKNLVREAFSSLDCKKSMEGGDMLKLNSVTFIS